MNTLAMRSRGEYCTDRVVHACLVFVGPATELSHTYKLLKPHLDFLLFQAVFPELCLSKKDIEVCAAMTSSLMLMLMSSVLMLILSMLMLIPSVLMLKLSVLMF